MSDAADDSDGKIEAMTEIGLARVRNRMVTRELTPIIQVMDGVRFGVCHFCETEIQPCHLFCPTDAIDPAESCAALWAHARARKKELGL